MISTIFGSRLRSKVIGWLFSHPEERYFVRQLEGILGEDSTNLSRELARLAEAGVLTCEVEGRQKYYAANANCPIFEELKGIAVKTAGVADVLRKALAPIRDRILVAFLYGSQASGKFDARSDVDVMIVGPATFAEVADATYRLEEKLGRDVNTTTYPEEEFREKAVSGHYFVANVLRGPKIFLIGDERDLAAMGAQPVADEASARP